MADESRENGGRQCVVGGVNLMSCKNSMYKEGVFFYLIIFLFTLVSQQNSEPLMNFFEWVLGNKVCGESTCPHQ